MILVIGGAYQGKVTWAADNLDIQSVCDLRDCEPVAGYDCYCHLEALTRRCEHPEEYINIFENAVVVSREIGSGIVPMDAEERAWRERHGSLLKTLAAKSDRVVRVFCGIGEDLK